MATGTCDGQPATWNLPAHDCAPQIGDFIGDELRFASEEGQMFHLPRDNHCEVSRMYCTN